MPASLTPSSVIRNALRKLTARDPHQHAAGRNYRVAAEIEPKTPETVTLKIKISSTTGSSFAISTAIPCPRDDFKSHISALIEEASAQGFILAESKDAFRAKAADFLKDNPLPKPEKAIKGPVGIHAKVPSPKRIVAKTPTGKKERPKAAEAELKTTLIQSAADLPSAMAPLYSALSQVQKPYTLSHISLRTHDDSKQCSVFVGFKMPNGIKVSRLVTIPNATMESSLAGTVVKESVAADILSTIQYATKVPQEALWELIAGDKTQHSKSISGSYTSR